MLKKIARASDLRKEKRREKDLKLLFYDCIARSDNPYELQWPCLITRPNGPEEAVDDDRSTVSSFSTTATVDDNPGPGRLVDKHIYQFFGRKVERLALRFHIYSGGLSPGQICQYFVDIFPDDYPLFGRIIQVKNVVTIEKFKDGRVLLAGLNSLVKQTRSGSIYQSAAALSAAIRVSTVAGACRIFYTDVYLVHADPMDYVGIPADSLKSQSESMYFRLLVSIGLANSYLHDSFEPSHERATHLREVLLRMMEGAQYSSCGNCLLTGDACALLSYAATCLDFRFQDETALPFIVDTIYFTLIFLLRSIPVLYHEANRIEFRSRQLAYMVLSAFVHWIDTASRDIILRLRFLIGQRPRLVNLELILRSPFYLFSSAKHEAQTLFPGVFSAFLSFDTSLFQRRTRAVMPEEGGIPPILLSTIETYVRRACRLINNFYELEREVLDTAAQFLSDEKAKPGSTKDECKEWPEEKWQNSYKKAMKAQVEENKLTKEFRDAREAGIDAIIFGWKAYKKTCGRRSIWGEHFRSNLDWDKDTTECLKRLFEHKRPSREKKHDTKSVGCPAPTVDDPRFDEQNETLNVSIGEAHAGQFSRVRVQYKTESGETKYKTFLVCPSDEKVDLLDFPTARSFEKISKGQGSNGEESQET